MERNPASRFSVWCGRLMVLAATAFAALWLIGYFRYTSVGLDRETAMDADRVQMDYYRIRWPGNGDIWIGGGGHSRPMNSQPLEPFDPASAFFIQHHPVPEPKSRWNRWGWWYFPAPEVDPSDARGGPPLVWGWWIGVPGWLPALILAIWPIRRWYRSRVRTRTMLLSGRAALTGLRAGGETRSATPD